MLKMKNLVVLRIREGQIGDGSAERFPKSRSDGGTCPTAMTGATAARSSSRGRLA